MSTLKMWAFLCLSRSSPCTWGRCLWMGNLCSFPSLTVPATDADLEPSLAWCFLSAPACTPPRAAHCFLQQDFTSCHTVIYMCLWDLHQHDQYANMCKEMAELSVKHDKTHIATIHTATCVYTHMYVCMCLCLEFARRLCMHTHIDEDT